LQSQFESSNFRLFKHIPVQRSRRNFRLAVDRDPYLGVRMIGRAIPPQIHGNEGGLNNWLARGDGGRLGARSVPGEGRTVGGAVSGDCVAVDRQRELAFSARFDLRPDL
jgi:hypothetical protein